MPLDPQSLRRTAVLIWLSSVRLYCSGVRVLVVEDDVAMATSIVRALAGARVVADVAVTGEEARRMAGEMAYDGIVLDVMLPDVDGFQTCRQLRQDGVWTPIIMLTARTAVEDRIRGLDVGADDYLTKPFSLGELLARLRALARREMAERPTELVVGSLRLDPASHQVHRGNKEIMLTPREFAMLEALMRRPGHVLSRLQLLDAAWDIAYQHQSNVLDVYVRYLREKVDRPFGLASIETVRGSGYRLRADGGG